MGSMRPCESLMAFSNFHQGTKPGHSHKTPEADDYLLLSTDR